MSDLAKQLRAHPGPELSVTMQFRAMVEQRYHAAAEIERLENELAKAQFQRNDRPMTREIIRALVLEVKRLRLELRQAQVMQVKV